MEKIKFKKQFKKYLDYKESGIDWIGKIPKSWEAKKIKDFSHISIGWTPDTSKPEYFDGDNLWATIADMDSKVITETKNNISEEAIRNTRIKKVKKGDLLYSFKLSVGKVAFAGQDMYTNEAIAVIEPSGTVTSKFLYYPLLDYFLNNANENIYGAKLLNQGLINNSVVALPPKIDQEKIAEYLDKKTELIEQIISKKQRLIQLLQEKRMAIINQAVIKGLDENVEMISSGIDWIGKIPSTWHLRKLKFISNTRVSNVDKKSEDEISVKLCNYLDVYRNEIIQDQTDFMTATATKGQIDKFGLSNGDVIITKDSESPDDIGVPAYVDLDDTRNIVCGYHLAISTPRTDLLLGKFLFRLFQSTIFRSYFEVNSNGMTRFGLNTYAIFNSSILLPPLNEQVKIIDFLDEKTGVISNAIDKIVKSIDLLVEYKASLISNVVTGKIII